MNCELCDEYGEELRLVGVVTADLCPKHRREFSNAAWEWSEFKTRGIKQSRQSAAIHAGDEERAAMLAEEMVELDTTLRKLALNWLAEQKAKVKDDAKADPA